MKDLEHMRELLPEGRFSEALSLVSDVVGLSYIIGHEPNLWSHGGDGLQDRNWGAGWGRGCGDGGPDDFLDGNSRGDYVHGDGSGGGTGEGNSSGYGKGWSGGLCCYGVEHGAQNPAWELWTVWWRG